MPSIKDISQLPNDIKLRVEEAVSIAATEIHYSLQYTSPWWTGTFNKNWIVSSTAVEPTIPRDPYSATDEIPDPQNLKMWLEVNGKKMQDGSTSTMVYGVNFLISYLSQFMSLQPGDIISTGTPPGVGMGMNPQVFLKPGDEMKLGIEGLGEQNQKTISA